MLIVLNLIFSWIRSISIHWESAPTNNVLFLDAILNADLFSTILAQSDQVPKIIQYILLDSNYTLDDQSEALGIILKSQGFRSNTNAEETDGEYNFFNYASIKKFISDKNIQSHLSQIVDDCQTEAIQSDNHKKQKESASSSSSSNS